MRYVRFKDGEFLKYSVALPFSDENHSFSEKADFSSLKEAGYYKFLETQPQYDIYTHRIDKINIVRLDDNTATTNYTYKKLTSEEQMEIYGVKIDLDFYKNLKIQELNSSVDKEYKNYMMKYGEMEKNSFETKQNEANKVLKDEFISLDLTPYLSILANNDINLRNELANKILDKTLYLAKIESFVLNTRKAIQNSTTKKELDLISVEYHG